MSRLDMAISNKRKICVIIGSRANYGSVKSVLKAIEQHDNLQLQIIAYASAVLNRYGAVVDLIRNDGFSISTEIFNIIEGETPLTMAKSTGLGLIELTTHFQTLKPDIVLSIGDRFETMATAIGAAYMNIPLAHTMGGEVSGTIDESIRHAQRNLLIFIFRQQRCCGADTSLEPAETIFNTGCPRIDTVAEILDRHTALIQRVEEGVGEDLDLTDPFIILSQHPVTTEYSDGESQVFCSLEALKRIGLPTIVLWPNSDAGSDGVAQGIRKWREQHDNLPFRFVKNLPNDIYIRLLKQTACLVGNSSSGIRDGAFIGTPVVNIGSRQEMRLRGKNVIDADWDVDNITNAIGYQIDHGHYPSDPLYGDGNAGTKIADILAVFEPTIQKRITY